MKRMVTFLAALLLIGATGFAQAQPGIIGSVKEDFSGKEMEGATVTIVTEIDSSFIKTTSTDRGGNFHFKSVNNGTYRIIATSLGYKKTSSAIITVQDVDVELAPLFLTPEVKSRSE